MRREFAILLVLVAAPACQKTATPAAPTPDPAAAVAQQNAPAAAALGAEAGIGAPGEALASYPLGGGPAAANGGPGADDPAIIAGALQGQPRPGGRPLPYPLAPDPVPAAAAAAPHDQSGSVRAHSQALLVQNGGGPDQLVRRVRHAAANHDFEALTPYMTPDLVARTRPLLQQDAARFWRHLDRYVVAGSQGFKMDQSPGAREGSLQLILSLDIDGKPVQLQPIVVRTSSGWRFERF